VLRIKSIQQPLSLGSPKHRQALVHLPQIPAETYTQKVRKW
jgi:hypothetical protein